MKPLRHLRWVLPIALTLGASALLAQDVPPPPPAPTLSSGDTAFVFACSMFVLLMLLPGLALFYAGLARAKNVLSVLMQVFSITAMLSLLWAIYGYSLVFSDGGSLQQFIGGTGKLFLANVLPDSLVGTIPEYLYFFFMLLFAAITPPIIVGGFAERMKYSAVMVFMLIWFTINYVPMAHMGWAAGGWIYNLGAQDFAGGNVVHVNVGVAALVGAYLIGKRKGAGTVAMTPHNMTMTMTGGSMLWVGWLGFCGGCAYLANGFAMMVVVNNMLAAAAGAMAWLLIEWFHRGKPSLLGALSGAIAGLVAITPACGFVGPMGAMAVGALASPVCVWALEWLKPRLGVDDAFDVFGVHGTAGIAGCILTTLFAAKSMGGVGYAEGRDLFSQMGVQLTVTGFSVVYSAISSFIAFKVTGLLCGGLRVTEDEEDEGLDTSSHGETGYRLGA